MKLLAGLREVIHNFTSPIEDTNAPTVEISPEAFVAMAKKSGMTPEQIQECLKNMNGIKITRRRSGTTQQITDNDENQKIEDRTHRRDATRENKDKGREPGE